MQRPRLGLCAVPFGQVQVQMSAMSRGENAPRMPEGSKTHDAERRTERIRRRQTNDVNMQTDSEKSESPAGFAPATGYAAGLRPCPLCGGKAKVTGGCILGGLLNNLGIECQTCGMKTRNGQFESCADLADFWNGVKPHGPDAETADMNATNPTETPNGGSLHPAVRLCCDSLRCAWKGDSTTVLRALDPFNEGCALIACPKCREQTIRTCCDEPDCWEQDTCGTPTPTGYRRTCGRHQPTQTSVTARRNDNKR
jgi:hypothetical protein